MKAHRFTRAALGLAALGLAALLPRPAAAALTQAELAEVAASPVPGTRLPGDLSFHRLQGGSVTLASLFGRRPVLLVLADYRCQELCGPILGILSQALSGTHFVAGRDYDLVVIGFNPAATQADAAAMQAAELGGNPALARTAEVLTGTAANVAALEAALRYRAVFDAAAGRYAHPADVFVLTPQGAISRVLPGLSVEAPALRLALVEASEGRIGTFADQLHLFCYGLDPARGLANGAVATILFGGGLATLGGLALFIRGLRRPAPEQRGGRPA